MPTIKRAIEIKFVRAGIHCFPAAATRTDLATGEWDDVSFLAHPHHHYFHFIVVLEVAHNDRDVEFIQFQRWCERLYEAGTLQCNSKSCEDLAEELIQQINARYPDRVIKVSVFEDNINGAHLEFKPW
mgnify:CR=1 FL=1